MRDEIPDYVAARIRAKCPDDCCVVPESTPVIAFGDVRQASVATLGLNPSRAEFLDREKRELDGANRRLETHRSVGYSDLSDAPASAVRQIFDGCSRYFSRRPYRFWFDKLETTLRAIGASYYDGTACHLDLIQWSTDPTWRKLEPRSLRLRLLDADTPFLLRQLGSHRIRLLLINGRAVINGFQNASGMRLLPVTTPLDDRTIIYQGLFSENVRVIAWTMNLQSSFGVSNALIRSLAEVVRQLYRGSPK